MSKVKIIAEIGMNHDGSMGQAKAFAKSAANCGVDAVKFQTHIAEAETLHNAPRPKYFQNESRFDFFKRTAFSKEQHVELKKYVESELGVEFISSPFSIAAVDLLLEIGVKTLKIPSGEVNNLPYLEYISETKKDIILSSGMSSYAETYDAYRILSKNGCRVIVLQCTSAYPCPAEKVGLNNLVKFKNDLNCEVGFSDHTLGISSAIMAVQLGATVIEKHYSISKDLYGPDAQFSATPSEMTQLVNEVRFAEVALSRQVDKDQEMTLLLDMKTTFEKSMVAKNNIAAGTKIEISHLDFKKPGDGLHAKNYRNYLGRVLAIDVVKDHKFVETDFK